MHDCFWLPGKLTLSKLFETTALSAVRTWWIGLPSDLDVFSWLITHTQTLLMAKSDLTELASVRPVLKTWEDSFFVTASSCFDLQVSTGWFCLKRRFQLMSSSRRFQTNIYVLLQLPNFFRIFPGLHWACGSLSRLPLSTKVPAVLRAVVLVSAEPSLCEADTRQNSALGEYKGLLLSYHLCYHVACLTAGTLLWSKVLVGIKTSFEKPIFMTNRLVSSKTVTRTV